MKRPRVYDDKDAYNNNKRHRPTGRWVPIRDPRTNRRFEFYSDLVEACTEDFASKHLIPHQRKRKKLYAICDYELGRYTEAFIHIKTGSSYTYKALYDACGPQAWERLQSILEHGRFDESDVNTLIVSSDQRIFLHMEKSNQPGYDLFLHIEQKRNYTEMSKHLSLDDKGKIYHYNP